MKEILIVRFSSLGDIVLLTGVLKYVKENIAEDIAIDLLTYSLLKMFYMQNQSKDI